MKALPNRIVEVAFDFIVKLQAHWVRPGPSGLENIIFIAPV